MFYIFIAWKSLNFWFLSALPRLLFTSLVLLVFSIFTQIIAMELVRGLAQVRNSLQSYTALTVVSCC